VNGVPGTPNTSATGGGVYNNSATFFGRRAGSALPFNGHEFASFGINRLLTAAELAMVEAYITGRTL
jgi:hypothetical protein